VYCHRVTTQLQLINISISVSLSCHFRPYINSVDEEVLLNNLTVNIPHLYSLFSCDCCRDADRYFIIHVAVLLAVFNVESVVL